MFWRFIKSRCIYLSIRLNLFIYYLDPNLEDINATDTHSGKTF